jgi:hypothetical protein
MKTLRLFALAVCLVLAGNATLEAQVVEGMVITRSTTGGG